MSGRKQQIGVHVVSPITTRVLHRCSGDRMAILPLNGCDDQSDCDSFTWEHKYFHPSSSLVSSYRSDPSERKGCNNHEVVRMTVDPKMGWSLILKVKRLTRAKERKRHLCKSALSHREAKKRQWLKNPFAEPVRGKRKKERFPGQRRYGVKGLLGMKMRTTEGRTRARSPPQANVGCKRNARSRDQRCVEMRNALTLR